MAEEQQTANSSSPSSDLDTLEGWTKQEKYELLMGLKYYGSNEPAALIVSIPSKSLVEIQHAVNYYKRKALKHPTMNERKRKEKTNVKVFPRIPIASWAKCLTDSSSYEDLQTETATALRLIADFENIPSPVCTNGIDFRKMYHFIADAMEGKSLPDGHQASTILDKCIVETALLSKSFMRNSTLQFLVENIDMKNQLNRFPKATANNELGNIEHLLTQRNYNPLNIPDHYLKASD